MRPVVSTRAVCRSAWLRLVGAEATLVGPPALLPTGLAPATHDIGDDHGGLSGGHGADDPANHDAGDDHGGHGGHGADD